MKFHVMTAWDAGQDLISCADHLLEKEANLIEGGFHDLAATVRLARFSIGKAFNKHGSHVFGLPDGGMNLPAQKRCLKRRKK